MIWTFGEAFRFNQINRKIVFRFTTLLLVLLFCLSSFCYSDNKESFDKAVKSSDFEKLEKLLKEAEVTSDKGLSNNEMLNTELYRLLTAACKSRNREAVEEIFRILDVETRKNILNKLLLDTIGVDDIELAGMLIEMGADLQSKDIWGYSLVERAVSGGNVETVNFLIEKGASLQEKNMMGHNPLWSAILNSDYKMADFLLSKGADINSTNDQGKLISGVVLLPAGDHIPFNSRKKDLKYFFSKGGFVSPSFMWKMVREGYWDRVFFVFVYCRYYSIPLFSIVLILIVLVFLGSKKKAKSV